MATLLEIVCKHVKTWPDGVNTISQDLDGNLYGQDCDSGTNYFVSVRQYLASDWSSQVTREQWESVMRRRRLEIFRMAPLRDRPEPISPAHALDVGRGLRQPIIYDPCGEFDAEKARSITLRGQMVLGEMVKRLAEQGIDSAQWGLMSKRRDKTEPISPAHALDSQPLMIAMDPGEASGDMQAGVVHLPASEYDLLRAGHAAWLSIMSALDEKHPDWAVGTNEGTLIERAVKAIKNGN